MTTPIPSTISSAPKITKTTTLTPGAAPITQAIAAQARAELTMTLRRSESMLATVGIPVIVLFLVMWLHVVPAGMGNPIQFLEPGIIALAIISSGMVSLSIATAYERYYGVLKRLGASPLPRGGLIVAKTLGVLAVEVVQVVALVLLGTVIFGWRPQGNLLAAILVMLIGTITFSAFGMLMAGALRAETTLAISNGLYILFIGIGGVIVPVNHLPGIVGTLSGFLPAAAFSGALRGALGVTLPGAAAGLPTGTDVLLLVVWGALFLVAAALTFKWE